MTKNSAKRRSVMDALHHRLAAFAPESDPAAYERHTQKYFEDCQPVGPVEIHLLQVIAHTAWWLHHLPTIEANLLEEASVRRQESVSADQPQVSNALALALAYCDQGKVLDKLSLHHERLSILFSKSFRQFLKTQADRRAAESKQTLNTACRQEQDGFVLWPAEIEINLQRKDRLKQAWNGPYYRA
jgi:hypothetical protein